MDLKIEYIYNGKNLKDYDIPIKTTLNDNIEIHYSLFLENGDKLNTPYDNIPFYFKELGYANDFGDINEKNNGTIIKGLDETIMRLTLGDFIRVRIPYGYAYGDKGIPFIIPEKSNLIYYLQVISKKRNDDLFKYPNIFNLDKIIKTDNINKIKNEIN
jgi:FKBP-type peptidyl-prolyl cis-trans isomerase